MANFILQFALFLLTFFVIIFNVFIRDKMLQYKNSELYNDNKLQILQYDIFRSIFDVKVLGLSITKHKNWNDYYDKYIESHKKSQIFVSNYQNVLSYITIFFPIYISLVGIWIGGILNTNEIGTIISLQSMSGIYISGLVSISQLSDNLTSLKSYIMRIEDILTQDDEKKGTAIINFKGNISVKNLSFHYPGSHDKVINNINFSVSEGESVAIVGESGSGKSTLFYILLGAYDDYSGIIEYEGVDLIKINKDHLREQVGVVPQNSLLFSGTIKENLSQERNYSDKFIYSILKKVAKCKCNLATR